MRNLHRNIESVSNIAIIAVALLFAGVLVNRYFFSASLQPKTAKNEIAAGTKMPLADIDWSKSDKTLLLALSTTCHFCTESAPFYQKLAQLKSGRENVRTIVVMPQSVDEARRYLDEHKILVDEVRQASLNTINVRGTPTLVVVDKTGAAVQSWVGKLPPEKETEIVQFFFR